MAGPTLWVKMIGTIPSKNEFDRAAPRGLANETDGLIVFWLAFDTPRGTKVFIVNAGFVAMARVKAGMAGQQGSSTPRQPKRFLRT
jgi:hypothetical protein